MKENDLAQRLMWTGLLAGIGFVFSIVTERVAEFVWRRFIGGEPPMNP